MKRAICLASAISVVLVVGGPYASSASTPTIAGPTISGTTGANGWYVSTVTLTYEVTVSSFTGIDCGVVHPTGQGVEGVITINIAEADDGAMSRLEGQMAELEKQAADGLKDLEPSLGPAASGKARAALEAFLARSKELIALSRRNTNVLSLSLAMSRLPSLNTACDAALVALAQALDRRGFTGTR